MLTMIATASQIQYGPQEIVKPILQRLPIRLQPGLFRPQIQRFRAPQTYCNLKMLKITAKASWRDRKPRELFVSFRSIKTKGSTATNTEIRATFKK